MVIVPVFSYAVGDYLAKQGFGRQILPSSWYVNMTFPPEMTRLSGLGVVAGWLASIPNLPATLAIAVLITVVVGGILSIVYGYMYSVLSPSKYGPMDVPPPHPTTRPPRKSRGGTSPWCRFTLE
jgi:hypothetical protein